MEPGIKGKMEGDEQQGDQSVLPLEKRGPFRTQLPRIGEILGQQGKEKSIWGCRSPLGVSAPKSQVVMTA